MARSSTTNNMLTDSGANRKKAAAASAPLRTQSTTAVKPRDRLVTDSGTGGGTAAAASAAPSNADPAGTGTASAAPSDGIETLRWNERYPDGGGFTSAGSKPSFEYGGGKPAGYAETGAPAYASRYGAAIDALAGQLLNREAFSYDVNSDALYQQYRDLYTRNGQRAMRDSMGQASSLTGGYGSSYAESVGRQQYDEYMRQLNAIIPQLEERAYNRYQDEGNAMRNNLSLTRGLEDTDYARFRDRYGDWQADRDFNYGQYRDNMNDYYTDYSNAYNQYRDRVNDYYTDYANAYNAYRDSVSDAKDAYDARYGEYRDAYSGAAELAGLMAAYGDFSGYKALGCSDGQIAFLRDRFAAAAGG